MSQKAYFHCHTDITIPYEELGSITCSYKRRRRNEASLQDGRFVLAGTEVLNEPLDNPYTV